MTHLGQFQLGDFVPFRVSAYRSNDNRTYAPDELPTVTIFAIGDLETPVATITLHVGEVSTNHFLNAVRLSSDYATGTYVAFATWAVDSDTYEQNEAFVFDVVGGGDADGAVIAATGFEGASYEGVVHQTESGKLQIGKNPR